MNAFTCPAQAFNAGYHAGAEARGQVLRLVLAGVAKSIEVAGTEEEFRAAEEICRVVFSADNAIWPLEPARRQVSFSDGGGI